MTRTLFHFLRTSLLLCLLLAAAAETGKAQYCTIGFSSGVEPITLVDFAGINNTSQSTGGTSYEDFTTISGNVVQGQSYTLTVKGNTFGNYSDYIRVFFDWDQDNDFTDAGEDFNVGIITNSNGTDAVQAVTTILVPFSSNLGSVRMRVVKNYNAYVSSPCNTSGWGQAEDYIINITSGASCSGTPVAGTATIPATICPNAPFTLSLTGYTSASGITIQWEEDNGSGWQPIFNATNASYNVSAGITVPTSYRAIVSCGSLHDTSNVGLVTVNLPTQCYCTISYPLSGGGPISLVNFGGINNATSAATGGPSYEDFTTISETVQQGQSLVLTVKGNTVGNYTDSVRVFFDWDQNGSFADPGESFDVGPLTNTTGLDAVQASTTILIPFSAALGATRMRVTKKYSSYSGPCNSTGYGQAEDYAINIVNSNSCFSTPTAGTASAPASVCPNTAFNLTLTGYSVDAGIYLQWQFYNTSTTLWEDIPSATNAIHTEPGITAPTDYRAIVTCTYSGLTDTSNAVSVAISPFISCYCTPVTSGGFGITNVQIANTTLNNSTSGGSAPNYYSSYPASGSTTATLMEGSSYYFSATFTAQAFAGFWIDYDQDGVFSTWEYTAVATANASGNTGFTIPIGALPGQTKMRVRSRGGSTVISSSDACSTFGSGETEDYTITIAAASYCSGTPSTGTLTAPTNICPGVSFNLSLTGYTVAADITIQWEEDYGSGWQPIAAATNSVHTVSGITVPTSYRAVVTCGGSAQSATTAPAPMTINMPNQCYCNITFPSGDVEPITLVDFAGINNPSSNTIGTPAEWEDFTGIAGTVNQGQSYTINVKGNTNGNYTDAIRVYIDWDQNGLFTDPGEDFNLGNIVNSTGLDAVVATTSIAVPSNAAIGATRMRVTKKWSSAAGPCNNTGYGQAEDYTLNVGFPLTINLADISATNVGAKNRVDWKTASEEKGDVYELERSVNGIEFQRIATKQAKGFPANYSYSDETPVHGMNYYRLAMKDVTGKTSYSRIVTAMVKHKASILDVYPNPVADRLTVSIYESSFADATLVVTDITGKVIKAVATITAENFISFNDVAPGIYLIRYTNGQHIQTIKVTKQ